MTKTPKPSKLYRLYDTLLDDKSFSVRNIETTSELTRASNEIEPEAKNSI